MTREGSPLKGTATIAFKEAADHITSARMHLMMLLVLLTAIGAVYGAIGSITETTAEDPFLFLKLLTEAREPLPSFAALLGFLLPLVAIALGFDAINGEYARRTMSRLLAQPIYRDAVLFGKFLGGLLVIAIALLTLWLLMTGLGILFLGLPPSAADIVRGMAYGRDARLRGCLAGAGDRLLDIDPLAGDLGVGRSVGLAGACGVLGHDRAAVCKRAGTN
ncbi:ABC transporter permease [Sinorhizobium americanum]|uniref:ABC-2 family transporter n=1 Tax=Sinorhizobium americanum TaxID=194963 RepID=A0A4R2BFI2_9HYPH|nr:ABC transporter permease subunit [Sinorhizobium americanum]TCN25243.1 ABC-2 family transporter [Sinorhizobium americanum]